MDDLSSRRDALDAELAERRNRENAALQRWAGLTVQRDEIEDARDVELERLEAERARVRDDARQRVAGVEADQAAVLLELNRDGRTVDQLSTLFALPLKQVREMLRAAKSAAGDVAGAGVRAPSGAARQPRAAEVNTTTAATPDEDAAPDRDSDPPAGAERPAGERLHGGHLGSEPADGRVGRREGMQDGTVGAMSAEVGSG